MSGRKLNALEQKLHQAALVDPKKTLTQKECEALIPDPAARVAAINFLLGTGLLKAMETSKGSMSFRAVSKNELDVKKNMSGEESMILSYIQAAGNEGIWTKHLKAKTELHQTVIDRCLKSLTQKQLVKAVKSVKFPTRKIYMLAHLEPSVEMTGGPWYTDNELDTEFIKLLCSACLRFIRDRSAPKEKGGGSPSSNLLYPISASPAYPTAQQILTFLSKSRITETQLSVEHVEMLLNVLVLDGDVERVPAFGAAMWDPSEDTGKDGSDEDHERARRRKRKARDGSDDSDVPKRKRKRSKRSRSTSESGSASDSEDDERERRRRRRKRRSRESSGSESGSDDERERRRKKKKEEKRGLQEDSEDGDADAPADEDVVMGDMKDEKRDTESKHRSKGKRKSKGKGKGKGKGKKRRKHDSDSESESESDSGSDDDSDDDSDGDRRSRSRSKSKSKSKSKSRTKTKREPSSSPAPVTGGGVQDYAEYAGGGGAYVYRAVRQERAAGGLAQAPCVRCPTFDFCKPGGPVNPQECTYYAGWLAAADVAQG
ncbi:RNA polymerase Rpc34 subunit-domain-containing protein [Trametes elegans]|nr:RNA polymerase Rpc34 subunit-domain-containing protein [Trametes elegans]